MGIIDKDKLTKSVDPVSLTPMHPRFAIRDDSNRTGNSRFGSTAIGDGQNAVMRFILSKLGEETLMQQTGKARRIISIIDVPIAMRWLISKWTMQFP